MLHTPRITPLPEDEWDDATRPLITANWFSDRPTKGQAFFNNTLGCQPDPQLPPLPRVDLTGG